MQTTESSNTLLSLVMMIFSGSLQETKSWPHAVMTNSIFDLRFGCVVMAIYRTNLNLKAGVGWQAFKGWRR
jgi:hypothetical protein